jgi:hypothetical protein
MSWMGLDRAAPSSHAPEAFRMIDDKLFGTNINVEENSDVYRDKVNLMSYDREQMARNTIITGILASEKSKNNLGTTKKKIINVTNKSLNADSLISVAQAQNEMLGIIAAELVQQRELQSQILELLTSHTALSHGMGRNEKPEKHKSKSVF